MDFKNPNDILNAYSSGFTGAYCDPKDVDKLLGELKHPLFEVCADNLYGTGEGKIALPFKALLKFDPGFGPAERQVVGDCVSHSTRNAVDISRAVQIINGSPQEFRTRGATEAIYGSRGFSGEGMTCSQAARFVSQQGGILLRLQYPFGDFRRYNGKLGSSWGARGVPRDVVEEAKKNQVRTTSLVTTIEGARDAITNGYAISVCSNQGFSSTRNEHGISNAQGTWMHAMCHPNYTEILTKRGWISVSEMSMEDEFCTLNPETHLIEWQKPLDIVEYDFDGQLNRFSGNNMIQIDVTPDHRMYGVIDSNYFDSDIVQDPKNYVFIEAYNTPKDLKIKLSANYTNQKVLKYKFKEYEIDMDVWLEFLGYFISEGCTVTFDSKIIRKDRSNNPYTRKIRRVEISQTKLENLDIIESCLNKLPFHFRREKDKWICEQKDLNEELQCFGKAWEKYIPDYVWDCGKDQLKILANALMLGDGTEKDGKYISYTTASKRLADDFQQLMLFIGYSAKITKNIVENKHKGSFAVRDSYSIFIRTLKNLVKVGKSELINYIGKVYCPSTKNGIVYTRVNGKPNWNGNCWIAVDDSREIYNETLFLVQNSWGNWNSGPKRLDQPDGSFWIRQSVAERMLKQNGSFVFSDIDGFELRNIDWTLNKIFS